MRRWNRQPECVKDHILDKYRDWNVADHYEWYDGVYECFVHDMEKCGIEVNAKAIYFSGFWSQGDGASFEGYISDWDKFIASHKLAEPYPAFCACLAAAQTSAANIRHDINFVVTTRGHYSHSHTMRSNWEYGIENLNDPDNALPYHAAQTYVDDALLEVDDMEQHLLSIFRSHADDLYRQLEEEHEYLTSDEAVLEALHSNDQIDEAIDDYYEEHDDEDEPAEETTQDVLPL